MKFAVITLELPIDDRATLADADALAELVTKIVTDHPMSPAIYRTVATIEERAQAAMGRAAARAMLDRMGDPGYIDPDDPPGTMP